MANKTGRTSVGSGRKKGSFSFALVSIAELKTKIADENMKFPVSRLFLEGLGFTALTSKPAENLTESIEGTTPQTVVGSTTIKFD
jgi:hypothetical protein